MKIIAAYAIFTGAMMSLLPQTGVARSLQPLDSAKHLNVGNGRPDPEFPAEFPEFEAIAAARNLLTESAGVLQFSMGMGQTPAQFYQNATDEVQSIGLLAQAQLPKADRVVKECRAIEDGANVVPEADAKYLYVKWKGRAPQDLSWQKEWNALSVLSISLAEKPSKGTLTPEGKDPSVGYNAFTYVPSSPEFTGTDRFSFLVKLSNGKSVLMRYQMEPGFMDHSFHQQRCVFATRLVYVRSQVSNLAKSATFNGQVMHSNT